MKKRKMAKDSDDEENEDDEDDEPTDYERDVHYHLRGIQRNHQDGWYTKYVGLDAGLRLTVGSVAYDAAGTLLEIIKKKSSKVRDMCRMQQRSYKLKRYCASIDLQSKIEVDIADEFQLSCIHTVPTDVFQ